MQEVSRKVEWRKESNLRREAELSRKLELSMKSELSIWRVEYGGGAEYRKEKLSRGGGSLYERRNRLG